MTFNWITTVCGILAAVPQFLNLFNVHIPEGIASAVQAIGTALLGIFAMDAKNK